MINPKMNNDPGLQELEHSLHNGIPKKESDFTKNYGLTSYILFFFAFSIGGWIWEVSLHFINYGVLVNRGTMWGPWLPIYGSGSIIVLVLLRKVFKRPVLTFFLAMLLTSTIEYMTGWYLETVHGMRWWNYNGYFMNLQGRICLEGSLVFAVGACLVIYVAAPKLDELFQKINIKIKKVICIVLICAFFVDLCFSSVNPNAGKGITSQQPCAEAQIQNIMD